MGYENFVLEAMSKENYEQVRDFAVNEYFTSMNEESQRAVATAYARVEKGMGTSSDEALVMSFYKEAELELSNREKLTMEARNRIMDIHSESVREALLTVIESGRAVSIAELFMERAVNDSDSLIIGLCKGLVFAVNHPEAGGVEIG